MIRAWALDLLARIFHNPIENSAVRRVRTRGLQSPKNSPCRPRALTRRSTYEMFGLAVLFLRLLSRLGFRSALSLILFFFFPVGLFAADSLDRSFNLFSGNNDTISAFVLQSDGKIVVAGSFATNSIVPKAQVLRLQSDGALDSSFKPVRVAAAALALQPDGQILIGGSFDAIDGISRRGLARVTAAGDLDATFAPDLPSLAPASAVLQDILKIVLQPDRKIVAVIRYQGLWIVARFLPDGTPDATFHAPRDFKFESINALALLPDGHFLLGGYPRQFGPNLVRLRSDGAFDTVLPTPPLFLVNTLAVQSDGKVLVGGMAEDSFPGSFSASSVLRLNADGSVDPSFAIKNQVTRVQRTSLRQPFLYVSAQSLAIQGDNQIVAAGWFTAVNGISRRGLVRLNSDGSLDGALSDLGLWFSDPVPQIAQMTFQPDGKLLVAGTFNLETTDSERGGLVRLVSGPAQPVSLFYVPQPAATNEHGAATVVIMRDGATNRASRVRYRTRQGPQNDAAEPGKDYEAQAGELIFAPGEESKTVSIKMLPDNLTEGTESLLFELTDPSPGSLVGSPSTTIRILDDNVGVQFGDPFYVAHEPEPEFSIVVRLSSPWPEPVSVDLIVAGGSAILGQDYFVPQGAIVFQPGEFVKHISVSILDDRLFEGTETVELKLQNPSGLADVGGNTHAVIYITDNDSPQGIGFGANGGVYSGIVQPDQHILLAGNFSRMHGIPRARVARLNPDLSLDPSFDPGSGPDGLVTAIARQPDGKILVGGLFTSVAGFPRNGLARLQANGRLDLAFDPGAGLSRGQGFRAPPNSLMVLESGRIVVAGDFSLADGLPRPGLAALEPGGALDVSFNPQIEGVVRNVAVDPNGNLMVAGFFARVNGVDRGRLAVLTPSGLLADPAGGVPSDLTGRSELSFDVVQQPDGALLIGGAFLPPYPSSGLLRFGPGGIDKSFRAVSMLQITSHSPIATDRLGKPIVAGYRNQAPAGFGLERFDPRGALDDDFDANFSANAPVYVVIPESNGNILVAGAFDAINELPFNHLAELDGHGGLIVPVKLESAPVLNGTALSLPVPGARNLTYVMESSTNLRDWIPVYTNQPSAGARGFTDQQVSQNARRFFRVRPLSSSTAPVSP